jgi:hypothetical protein
MQQRRYRPGDVLDDYCPRERRVTDHAIVAMIDDNIKQTRCVVCDAEHEYKQAKVPPQRKKKAPALFKQVLDGLQAPTRPPYLPDTLDEQPDIVLDEPIEAPLAQPVAAAQPLSDVANGNGDDPAATAAETAPPHEPDVEDRQERVVDGPFRRQLIRAALPRPEGTPPPARAIPEFTIRQPMGRGNRHAGSGRRRGQHQSHGTNGPARFGRGGHGQRSNGHGRPSGHGGQGGANGNRMGGSRRGGKKR